MSYYSRLSALISTIKTKSMKRKSVQYDVEDDILRHPDIQQYVFLRGPRVEDGENLF